MPSFDEAWTAAARNRDSESVSPKLQILLQSAYSQIVFHPTDLIALKTSLMNLLGFLKDEGRTNANCWAVDLFFAKSEGWERDWADQGLPESFHDVLAMMGRPFTIPFTLLVLLRTSVVCQNNSSNELVSCRSKM